MRYAGKMMNVYQFWRDKNKRLFCQGNRNPWLLGNYQSCTTSNHTSVKPTTGLYHNVNLEGTGVKAKGVAVPVTQWCILLLGDNYSCPRF